MGSPPVESWVPNWDVKSHRDHFPSLERSHSLSDLRRSLSEVSLELRASPMSSSRVATRQSLRKPTILSQRNAFVRYATQSMDIVYAKERVAGSGVPSFSSLPSLLVVPVFAGIGPRLDMLPMEVLSIICAYVINSENGPVDVYNMLSTCGRLYDVGVACLYRHVEFRTPRSFDKFRWAIEGSGYGQHVRVLDFSAFTSVGLGRTSRMNMEIQMVTARTILLALEQCHNLEEFLAAESIDTDMSPEIMDKLLSLPMLTTLDFCGATNPTFVNSLRNSYVLQSNIDLWNIRRLSLHCCSTIPTDIIGGLLQKLVNIEMLDLTQTLVDSDSLLGIPATAKLTHLSLARCTKIKSHTFTKFLLLHPSVRNLQWLSIMFEATRPNPLTPHAFDTILRFLPPVLEHLNICGQQVVEEHLDIVAQRFPHLQSLSLGHVSIALPKLIKFISPLTELRYLGVVRIPQITPLSLQDMTFLTANTHIVMFEVSLDVAMRLVGVKLPGFLVQCGRGRRAWIHRCKTFDAERNNEIPQSPSQSFSFAAHARERMMRQQTGRMNAVQQSFAPLPPANTDPVWRFAAHKINVSEIGLGGVLNCGTCGADGIYNYFSYDN